MPLHQIGSRGIGMDRDRLLASLVHELREPQPIGQPIILEEQTPETKTMRVYVIWDLWEECPRELRSDIILDAYGEARGDKIKQEITLVLGVTVPEAADMGLLSYTIEPTKRQLGSPSYDEHIDAMLKAGASVLTDPHRPQLRFASLEDAEAAVEHLQNILPKSKWLITQEVLTPSGS